MLKVFGKTVDLYLCLILVIFTFCMMTQLGSLSEESLYMPRAVLIFMLFSSVWIGVRAVVFVLRNKNQELVLDYRNIAVGVLIPGGIVLMLSLMLKLLGFYLCSTIIIFIISMIQDFVTNSELAVTGKKLVRWALFSVCTSVVLYLFFNKFIKLVTPAGILGI